jgi:hypothetical protein
MIRLMTKLFLAKLFLAKLFLFSLFLFCSTNLRADLFVCKLQNGELLPLTSRSRHRKVYDLLMKHSFPMNSNPSLKIDKKLLAELYEDEAGTIERLLRKKVDKNLRVLFVPSVLSELFVMRYYLDRSLGSESLDTPHALSHSGSFYTDSGQSVDRIKFYDRTEKLLQKRSSTNVWKFFDKANRDKNLRDVHFLVNRGLLLYLYSAISFSGDAAKLSVDAAMGVLDMFNRDFEQLRANYWSTESPVERSVDEELLRLKVCSKDDHEIFRKAIELEYKAHARNSIVLYRGCRPIDTSGESKGDVLLDSVLEHDKSEDLYEHSVSYGMTLFSGFFNDLSACAYYYMRQEGLGYGVLVEKKEWRFGKLSDLFYIPSLGGLTMLYASGDAFHPRTKICRENESECTGFMGGLDSSKIRTAFNKMIVCSKKIDEQEKKYSEFLRNNTTFITKNAQCSFDEEAMRRNHLRHECALMSSN